ncbi:MAG: porin family protein [Lentimicrobium sp.]|jgi:outer membrane protein W|nr:porin family protein [Lentimicrobium sp.]
MKKIILLVVTVFAFGFANAQDKEVTNNGFSKGNKFLEGSFSFRSGDVEDSWALTPKMGYMLDDKWAIGGFLAMGGTKNNTNDKHGNFGIGAFARYYFLSLGESKSFQAYGEFGLGYSALTTEPNGGSKRTDSAMNANIDLGINYFFTPHWAATFELANILSYNNANPENGSNSSDLNVNINLFNNIFAQPQFGLLYKW